MNLTTLIKKTIKKTKNTKYLFLLFITLLITVYFSNYPTSQSEKISQVPEISSIQLIGCTDGDTAKFIVDGKEIKVRFLAIDTPEVAKGDTVAEPFGNEAAEYTCSTLKSATTISFEYEEKESDLHDRYGRLLAWVFVDGSLLQEKLVQEGLAEAKYGKKYYKYTSLLEETQETAKNKRIGIWSMQ